MVKVCTICNVELPLTAFYGHRQSSDGRKSSCKKCHNRYSTQWNEKNRKAVQEYRRVWNARNRENHAKYSVEWRKRNPKSYLFSKSKRRAAEYRIPAWANRFFMEEAYELAALRSTFTGIKWHVDHIVPLVHPKVCGLHVHTNLRIVPAVVNQAKGNRYWPDMT